MLRAIKSFTCTPLISINLIPATERYNLKLHDSSFIEPMRRKTDFLSIFHTHTLTAAIENCVRIFGVHVWLKQSRLIYTRRLRRSKNPIKGDANIVLSSVIVSGLTAVPGKAEKLLEKISAKWSQKWIKRGRHAPSISGITLIKH